MLLSNLIAEPNPSGGRIGLSWTVANGSGSIKILRRAGRFPNVAEIEAALQNLVPAQVRVFDAVEPTRFSDSGLKKSETVYYYAVIDHEPCRLRCGLRQRDGYWRLPDQRIFVQKPARPLSQFRHRAAPQRGP